MQSFYLYIFFRLWEPPYWMLFPVKVDTKLCEGSMLSRVFICEHSTRIICTCHTPTLDTITSSVMALVSVVGVVDGQGTLQAPVLSAPAEKKNRVEQEKASATNRVHPVMENLEKSWNSIIFFQAWKSHGN